MIGLTLAFTMAIVGDSAKASVDKSVAENFIGDYIVSNVFGGPFSTSIANRMEEVDGVARRDPRALRDRHPRRRPAGDRGDRPRGRRRPQPDMIRGEATDLADGTVMLKQSGRTTRGSASATT